MRKNVLVCGLIAGIIASSWILASILVYRDNFDFDNGALYGYTAMILAFSLIFVGVKNYRDKYNGGTISFGKAFLIGFYIVLIASTLYVITWLFDYYFFVSDFADRYSVYVLQKLKASGAGPAAIAKRTAELASFKGMYGNPVFNILLTYTDILPVGIIIDLISALILKRKKGLKGSASHAAG